MTLFNMVYYVSTHYTSMTMTSGEFPLLETASVIYSRLTFLSFLAWNFEFCVNTSPTGGPNVVCAPYSALQSASVHAPYLSPVPTVLPPNDAAAAILEREDVYKGDLTSSLSRWSGRIGMILRFEDLRCRLFLVGKRGDNYFSGGGFPNYSRQFKSWQMAESQDPITARMPHLGNHRVALEASFLFFCIRSTVSY